MGRSKSNDACNALQRAIYIDPNNTIAKDMLKQELRKRNSQETGRTNHHQQNHHHQQHQQQPQQNNENPFSQYNDQDDYYGDNNNTQQQQTNNNDIDDDVSWKDKIYFYISNIQSMYENQSNDIKTIIKIFLVGIVLYIGFGGRFGFENLGSSNSAGNYLMGMHTINI